MKNDLRRCKRCLSEFCSGGFKGKNSGQTKIILVAHMLDKRIFEKDLFGEIGHYRAFLQSDSGKALQAVLAGPILNLNLEDIYFTNIFKGFFKDRMPRAEEYRACLERFEEQVEDFQPRGIVSMGSHAYDILFPEESKFADNIGRILLYQNIPTLATYHPSTIMKMPIRHRMRLIDFLKSGMQ